MALLSTIKTLGGAVILRTLETYRLLITRFWWLLGFLIAINALFTSNIAYYGSSLILVSVILLLSRSSVVQKGWRYVFFSNQTVGMLAWDVSLLAILGLLSLFPPGRGGMVTPFDIPSTGGIILFISLITITPALILFWAYVLLDTKITLSNALYIVPQSILLGDNLSLSLVALPATCIFAISFYKTMTVGLSFLLATFLFFPLYAAFIAVLYEEMHDCSGAQL